MLGNQEKEINVVGFSKKSSLFGVFLIVLSIAVYMLFTNVISDGVSIMKIDLAKSNEELSGLNGEIQKYKEFEEKLDLATVVNKQEVLNAVPIAMAQDQVIENVINIADTYDITLNSISFSKGGGNQEGVKSLVVNASFIGNYNDLVDFLEGIEQNSRIFKVSSISVQISKLDISKIERASFSLAIETFYQD